MELPQNLEFYSRCVALERDDVRRPRPASYRSVLSNTGSPVLWGGVLWVLCGACSLTPSQVHPLAHGPAQASAGHSP